MTQQLLPIFPKFPEKHLRWLRLANAGDFYEKKCKFYPLKTEILHKYAAPDGWDLQVIRLKCDGCGGTGIWRSEWTGERDSCRRCNATGIYDTRRIALRRWLLNGAVFHEPERLMPVWNVEYRERIYGLVKHEPVDSKAARRAFEKLLLRYRPERWLSLQYDRLRNAMFWRVRMPLVNRLRAIRGRFVNVDDIPF